MSISKEVKERRAKAESDVEATIAERDRIKGELEALRASGNGKGPSKKALKAIEALGGELDVARLEVRRARVRLRRAYGGLG